jgi:hypothetical protein
VPGATLVLYTDGAVEHSRDVLEGEAQLLRAVAGIAEHREEDPATYIHQAIFQGRPVGDDVAILTVGFATNPAIGLRISAEKAQSGFAGRIARSSESADAARRASVALRPRWGEWVS